MEWRREFLKPPLCLFFSLKKQILFYSVLQRKINIYLQQNFSRDNTIIDNLHLIRCTTYFCENSHNVDGIQDIGTYLGKSQAFNILFHTSAASC